VTAGVIDKIGREIGWMLLGMHKLDAAKVTAPHNMATPGPRAPSRPRDYAQESPLPDRSKKTANVHRQQGLPTH
jgi:hypothetical protein